MPCYFPLQAWRSKTVNASGKRSLVFDRRKGFEDMPVTLPCGQCIGCRLEHSRQWAMRCVCEAQLYVQNSFITLTYSDDLLPDLGSLVKSDFQKFMKRLRFKYSDKVIRFYACGEYGENTKRPHYHACIFNHSFSPRVLHSRKNGFNIYRSAELEKLWPFGFSYLGDVSFDSAAYVARYITKKISGKLAESHYAGRLPEFALMSLKPGIGKDWFDKYHRDVFPSDSLIMRGKSVPAAKYFLKLLESKNPVIYKKVRSIRLKNQKLKASNVTLERLKVRYTCAKSQTLLKKGSQL